MTSLQDDMVAGHDGISRKLSKIAKITNIAKNCQWLPKDGEKKQIDQISKHYQNISTVAQCCQKWPKVAKIANTCQQLPRIATSCIITKCYDADMMTR